MPGWIPIVADDWFVQRTQIEGEWPTVLVITDLRFWDNPIACSKRPRPTVKALRETWGWSQGRAYRFIMAPQKWLDPGTKKSKESGTPPENDGTPPKTDGTGDVDSTGVIDDDRNEGGTKVERERNDIENPLIETHARTHTPTHTPTHDEQEQVSDKPAAPPLAFTDEDWSHLTGSYREWYLALGKSEKAYKAPRQPRKASKTKAGLLLKLALAHGLDDLNMLLRFAAVDVPTMEFYRDNAYGLDTWARPGKADRLIGLARKGAKGEHQRKGPTPDHLISFADPTDVKPSADALLWIPNGKEVQTGVTLHPDAPEKAFPERIRFDVRRCVLNADTVACRGSDEWAAAYDESMNSREESF